MIRVTVEIIPYGLGTPRTIGVMHIANDGLGTTKRGNYDGKILRKPTEKEAARGWRKITRKGRVENYPRQSYAVWRLILRMLKAMYPEG